MQTLDDVQLACDTLIPLSDAAAKSMQEAWTGSILLMRCQAEHSAGQLVEDLQHSRLSGCLQYASFPFSYDLPDTVC